MVYEASKNTAALIFDFDGTLVDSMPAHYLSWKAAFKEFGADFSEDFFYDHAGVSLKGVVEAYNRRMGTNFGASAVVSRKDAHHAEYLDATKPIPVVLDVVHRYHGRLPMAVATGNSRVLTEPLMARLDLRKYFDIVVFGEDVKAGKPDPESFLTAARAMKVPPSKCEVFEDGEPGILAAKRAGMTVIDIREWLK